MWDEKHVWLSQAVGWWDVPLALKDLAKAIPIISGNGLPLLTESNFQTPLPCHFYLDPHPPIYWYLHYLLDSTPVYWYLGICRTPPPPLIIWNWRVCKNDGQTKWMYFFDWRWWLIRKNIILLGLKSVLTSKKNLKAILAIINLFWKPK